MGLCHILALGTSYGLTLFLSPAFRTFNKYSLRMKKLFVLFTILVNTSIAQNFPYLNASTGNPNFFTDKDTNMYFTHGNRLAKVDKSFNPVWVNTYGSLYFKSILLSKTGSMYFIAGTYSFATQNFIGKIEADGSVGWMKSTVGIPVSFSNSSVTTLTISANSFFLDSANNILLSGTISSPGNVVLVKMDTLGNVIKARTFGLTFFSPGIPAPLNYVNILNARSGKIHLVAQGNYVAGAGVGLQTFSYSDVGDSVVASYGHGIVGCSNCSSSFGFSFYKSKTRSDIFYLFGHIGIFTSQFGPTYPQHFVLEKYSINSLIWSREYKWTGAPATAQSGLDEDEDGNIFGVINTTNSLASHHSGFVKFDSTGATNGNWIKYFNGYNPGTMNYPDDRVNVVHSNRYFMNVVGAGFPSNPLITAAITPSLTMVCSNSVSLTPAGANTSTIFSNYNKPGMYTITSMTIGGVSPTVTTVSGFSVSPDFCLVMNTSENELGSELSVYPNPSNEKMFIQADGVNVTEVRLYDIDGRKVLQCSAVQEIDLSALQHGIYLLKIETDKGVLTKKIIKE
jgi:hypothetical protein